jgi:site-specific DNA recombinase
VDKLVMARCYMRVSTEEQAQSGYSLAAQRDKLELFCQLQGYQIAGWYRDDGVSAKDLNRPEFQRMMKDAQPQDVIVVYKLDRLTRSVRDLDDLLSDFEKRSIHFRSVTEQFDTTNATGRLMIRMVGEFAQWERETIAERTAFGKQKKFSSGEWNGGRVAFGYTTEPSGKMKGGKNLLRLVPDPTTSQLIPKIFEKYLAGHGSRQIAIWLNEELGARSAKGGRFSAEQVMRILGNPTYIGAFPKGKKGGDREWVKGEHEPLVSLETYERAQEVLKRRKQLPPRQATGVYVLTGVARCGVCGGPLTISRLSGKQKGQYTYRCRAWNSGMGCGDGKRPLTSSMGHLIEANVVEAIAALGEPETLDRFYHQIEADYEKRLGMTDVEIRRLRQDLTSAEMAVRRWDQAYETGEIALSDYLARVKPHRGRIEAIRTQLEAVTNTPAPPPKEVLANFLVNFRDIWQDAEPEERKMLLQHFCDGWGVTIYLFPGLGLDLVIGSVTPAPGIASPGSAG